MPATVASEAHIERMVETIVLAVRPAKVVLFGSYARDEATEDSDVDLLVVADQPFESAQQRIDGMAYLWKVLARFRIPKDILLYSKDEVARWGATTNHIVARALREGRVLYERP